MKGWIDVWEARFWKAVAERMIRQFAFTLAGMVTVGMAADDWRLALEAASVATFLSLLASVVASGVGPAGPSFGQEEVPPGPPVGISPPPVA